MKKIINAFWFYFSESEILVGLLGEASKVEDWRAQNQIWWLALIASIEMRLISNNASCYGDTSSNGNDFRVDGRRLSTALQPTTPLLSPPLHLGWFEEWKQTKKLDLEAQKTNFSCFFYFLGFNKIPWGFGFDIPPWGGGSSFRDFGGDLITSDFKIHSQEYSSPNTREELESLGFKSPTLFCSPNTKHPLI